MDDAQELASWTPVTPVGDLLLRSAARYPDRDAVVFPGERYTFAQLWERASVVARGLLGLGVKRGQHVGLLARNGIEYVEGLFGISLTGAVVIPVNARHKTSELRYIIDNGHLVAELTWPEADPLLLVPDSVTIAVQVMGKLRGTIEVAPNASAEVVLAAAETDPNVAKALVGKRIVKRVHVPNRIVNFVVAG